MGNWHSETIERFKGLPIESLEYIKGDAYQRGNNRRNNRQSKNGAVLG
jgi:hypothetical protein